jgi:hypothetical protein
MSARAALALLLVLVLWPATSASAAQLLPPKKDGYDVSKSFPEPSPVDPQVFRVDSYHVRPPGFRIDGLQAVAIANSLPAIKKLVARYPEMKVMPTISPLAVDAGTFYHWSVQYLVPGSNDTRKRGEVEVGPEGHVYEVTTGVDVGWPIEHGYKGVLGQKLNAPYIWLTLCFFFLLPFFDFRHPFRLLHLDLVMLLGFGASHYFFNLGKPWISVPLIYPALLYCAGRMAVAGFRPARRRTPLIPHIGNRVLLVLLVVLLALRGVFAFTGAETFDVGFAGVIGADRIAHGQELYVLNDYHGDTYGPVNYLAYVPFELAFPYHGEAKNPVAAEAASVAFDALMVLGLFFLGRRLRRGPPGTRLGLALAVAWTAYPYTSLVLASSTNDVLVPLFVVGALLAIGSAPGRACLLALGTMVKFVPGLLVPPLAAGNARVTWRVVIFLAAFALACALLILPFLPDGGFSEFWNTTLGFQLHRTSPLTLWGRNPDLAWVKTVIAVLVVAFSLTTAWWPRRRSTAQVAALSGAVLAAAQLGTGYWLYFYIVWFAPFLLIGSFSEHADLGPTGDQERTWSSLVKPVSSSQPESVTATRSSIRTPSTPGR